MGRWAICGAPDDELVRVAYACALLSAIHCRRRGPPEVLQPGIDAYLANGSVVDAAVQWPSLTQLQVAGWPSTLAVQGGVEVLLDGELHGVSREVDGGAGRHLLLDIADVNAGPLQCGTSVELRWRSTTLSAGDVYR